MIPLYSIYFPRRSRSIFRHSQGGMGLLPVHRPRFSALAPASNAFNVRSFGAYLRYYHARPMLTSCLFRLRPSGRMTSPTIRPYLSVVWTRTSTSIPNAISDVNRFARVPKGCPLSGQSIPCRRTFTARPLRMTLMVSPSDTPTTLPVNVSAAIENGGINRNSRTRRDRKMLCLGLVFPEHIFLVIYGRFSP